MDYTYIVCKNHPQIYLEKCKYKTKKYKLPNLYSDSDSESSDSDSNYVQSNQIQIQIQSHQIQIQIQV